MSRHSRNCTSQSIFTYGEKQKLKGEYGSKQQRIGQDSIKKFQMCTICNNLFVQPVCCSQGHIFCRDCAIQFMVKQKKIMSQKKQQLELLKKKREGAKQQQKFVQDAKKILQFEKYDNFQSLSGRKQFIETSADNQKQKNEKIDPNQCKPVGIYEITSKKQKYVRSSFWAIQNTTQIEQKLDPEQVDQIVKCPGGSDHKLTLKKLRPLIIKKIENDFCCGICNKEIRRQKIGSYKCGHVVCAACKSQKCQLCGKKDNWIAVESSSSAFSQHNKAEVKTYTHAFYI